ncbi:MAG: hypothetical protein KBD23_05600 [Gammaproteobacteria bacterium]|nr:hypothetical protein [Gammaproteobacteria bacterium]MBP9729588.1 hypothetical protein [Gammaproteobacteria bacterium]
MNMERCLITNKEHRELCKIILNVLNCNVLWIMNVENSLLSLLATDLSILEYYLDKKYYLQDPNILSTIPNTVPPAQVEADSLSWTLHLGSDCETFKQDGFLYNLYNLFDIQEFASIEKYVASQSKGAKSTQMTLPSYCFRFFTRNNRFVFMNKLLNNMPFIRFFMNAMIKKLEVKLRAQSGVSVLGLN